MYAFLLNGFHELCHSSVFKTKALNHFFTRVFAFLGLYNHVHFWASHQEHHKYTLHPPDDLEVVLPVEFTLQSFLKAAVINPWGFYQRFQGIIQRARGQVHGEWDSILFPPEATDLRRRLFGWARFMLFGHLLIAVVSLALGLWLIPVLITLAPFYGGWLLYLCNNTQHVGLQDETPDYRLNTRTIILNPFVRFLYWHMNFHIEHHMYAAVPCYNLGKLHALIEHDLPRSPNGLIETWTEIITIMRRQKVEPDYHYVPELPAHSAA